MRHIHFADGIVACRSPGLGVRKFVVGCRSTLPGQMAEELEDSGFGPLVLAEGLVIDEQIADEAHCR